VAVGERCWYSVLGVVLSSFSVRALEKESHEAECILISWSLKSFVMDENKLHGES
jgi:hypothetical protein